MSRERERERKSKFSCIAVAIAELYLLFEGKGQTYIIQVVLKGAIQWRFWPFSFQRCPKGVSNECFYLRLVGIAKKTDGQEKSYWNTDFFIGFMIEDYD